MDISTINPKSIEDAATRPQSASRAEKGLSALSASFKEFMKTGLGGASAKGGKSLIDPSQIPITATDTRAAPPDPIGEPVREASYEDAPERYDSRDRLDENGRGGRRDNDRFETRRDDPPRERVETRGDAPSENPSGPKAQAQGETQARDGQNRKSDRDSQTPKNSSQTASSDAPGSPGSQRGEKTLAGAAKAGDALEASVLKKRQGTAAKKAPEDALSAQTAQIAIAQAATLSGRPVEQAKSKKAEAGGRENALNGLSKALEATSKGPAAQASAQQGKQTGAQSKTDPSLQNQTNPQAPSNAAGKAAQQAADLSRIVGAGNKISVEVKSTSEAETLVSKPKSTIVSNALAANKPAATPQGAGAGTTSSAAANLGQNATGDAQQALNQQVRQAKPTPAQTLANGSSASGPGSGGGQAGAGIQTAQAGGGEISTPGAAGANTEAQQSQRTTPPKAQAQARQANLPKQAIVDQVLVQISKAANEGADKINIQLKPGSLGRVDVQLKLGQDGKVSAVVTADKQDTLDLLQRDAKSLEQALKDAGMDLTEENLSFNLRGEENNDTDGDQSGFDGGLAQNNIEDEQETTTGAPLSAYQGGIRPDGRVDIRA